MRKFYSTNNARNIIAISETKNGEIKAYKRGYRWIYLREMTKGEKACLRNYDKNKPTEFPAIFLA